MSAANRSGCTAPEAWFSCVGLPLAPSDRAEIEALIRDDALLARVEIGVVSQWHEAGEIIRAADRDSAWWDHEEEERERLWQCAAERYGEDELSTRLRAITDALADAVHDAAAAAAARAGVVDPALIRAASGAALMAAHQQALCELAGEGGTHYFTRKFALFAGGRWPLGYHRGRYVVF